mgnify:CR=1 FL=1
MDKLENNKLAIIGGGHIGLALVEGFINSGKITSSQLIVANPTLSKIAYLKKKGVRITTDNKFAVKKADWIFLAVKPFVVDHVLTEIRNFAKEKLVISLAAAVTIEQIKKKIIKTNIVRIMPNMSISCNQGVIGLFSKELSSQEKIRIKELLTYLGLVVEVEKEKDLDILTLVSGCGPAIVSQFIEILARYGISKSLSSSKSHTIALQTFKGTVALLENSGLSSAELIKSVATKGGITKTIINKLKQRYFQRIFDKAMDEGYNKIKEVSRSDNN